MNTVLLNETPGFFVPCKSQTKVVWVFNRLFGTFRSENNDGNGDEEGDKNVALKVNLGFFNLHRDYSNLFILSNVG